MNLQPITVEPALARERLAEYEKAVRDNRDAEDEAMAAGYRAAARGMPIIVLPNVIGAGGWFDNGLPRLAVARADSTNVRVDTRGRWNGPPLVSDLTYTDADRVVRPNGRLVGANHVNVRVAPDDGPTSVTNQRFRGQTVVPHVPPRFRPRRGRLGRFHVLWEVEKWDPTPPVDPALIRHIGGDLWAVVAVWDLTPLERAVLSARTER